MGTLSSGKSLSDQNMPSIDRMANCNSIERQATGECSIWTSAVPRKHSFFEGINMGKTISTGAILCAAVLFANGAVSADEFDFALLDLLKSANDEQTSHSQRGSMTFEMERSWFASDGVGGSRELIGKIRKFEAETHKFKGTVEWDKDYLFLDGIRDESKPGANAVTRRHDEVKLVIAGGKAIAKVSHLPKGKSSQGDPLIVSSPVGSTGRVGIDGLYIPPLWLLTSPEVVYKTNLSDGLFRIMRDSNLTAEQRDAREMEVNDNLVTVKCMYYNGTTGTHVFDLNLGARCVERKSFTYDGEYGTYQRHWKQNPEGRWYPELTTGKVSRTGFEGPPSWECKLVISEISYRPKHSIKPPLSLTAFGPIPSGTSIKEIMPDGKVQHRSYLRIAGENAQDELDRVAGQIENTGFGAAGDEK
jgi:hypothetical protein